MFEFIKVLLPLIIQLIGNKQVASANDAVDCIKTAKGQNDFAAALIAEAIRTGAIQPTEAPEVVLELAEAFKSPVLPVFVDALYMNPALAGE